MSKVASKKSKSVVVVYFGSPDNFDMPSELDYRDMVTRLGQVKNPEDIRAFPGLLAGNKMLKVDARVEVIIEGDSWGFAPTKDSRSRKDIENDKFVVKAAEQLDSFLTTGKPRFVLVPYYAKLLKK